MKMFDLWDRLPGIRPEPPGFTAMVVFVLTLALVVIAAWATM